MNQIPGFWKETGDFFVVFSGINIAAASHLAAANAPPLARFQVSGS
jgi:hypothetical protein